MIDQSSILAYSGRADIRKSERVVEEARKAGKHTAFLSHSRKDSGLAKCLQGFLQSNGWLVYIDWDDTPMPSKPNRETAKKIKDKIQRLDWFLYLATSNSASSRWCPLRPAWNKGRIVVQKRPLMPKHVWAIRVRLELAANHRDLALFNMAIDSKLRGCDLVRMQVVDVMSSGQIKERASVMQSKTQKPVRFEITEGTRAAVAKWMEGPLMVGSEYLWPGRFHERLHISTRQYARIVRDWVTSIGLEATAFGTHSMRRTKVTQIYKKTGNFRAVQLLLGQTKMDSMREWQVSLVFPWLILRSITPAYSDNPTLTDHCITGCCVATKVRIEPECMYQLLFASDILAWLAVVADMYPACLSARGPWPLWVTHAP